MKRSVVAAKDDKKGARLLRMRRRSERSRGKQEPEPEGLPPSPGFPTARGLRTGALLSLFDDSAISWQAAAS